MISYRRILVGVFLACAPLATTATAQPLGTFRWQLAPFCNVVTVAITQNGAVYRLEGTDDQCGGGADAASVTGTAFPNADGTIGLGLNIVTAPGGRPLHVDAEINLATFSGSWRDSAGASGTFAFTPGAGNGGSPRPLPTVVPSTIVMNPDGAFVAGGVGGAGAIPASGPGVRMMWYPGKAAFRAGRVFADEWDDARVGFASTAMGSETTASGYASTAMGNVTTASGDASTAMGNRTTASAPASTAMGSVTTASGFASAALGSGSLASGAEALAMGDRTTASGNHSTALGASSVASGTDALAGGASSVASGSRALAFGLSSRAVGAGSVALGTRAVGAGIGSFAFGDSSAGEVSAGTNEFKVRASGGVFFYSNATLNVGVALAPSGNQWLTLSDVRSKHHFRDLDGDDVLAKIARMPVTEWSYRAQDTAIRHIGPTAQDFHAAFGLGEDPLRIGTLDADGVALAGVKALETRSRQHAESIDRQAEEVASLKAEIARLRALVLALTGSPPLKPAGAAMSGFESGFRSPRWRLTVPAIGPGSGRAGGLAMPVSRSILATCPTMLAADFNAAFGLGEDPLRFGTLDADGGALAAVKAVEARTREMRPQHDALRERVVALERALAEALDVVRALKGGRR